MSEAVDRVEAARRGALRTAAQAVGVVLLMGGMSFAAVPFYDWFCRVTGFGGTTQRAETGADRVSDQTITIQFVANTHRDMPWRFEPVQSEMTVRIGETNLAFYRATNPTDQPISGTATFNVAPLDLGGYFAKIECFCFTEQTLQPGESIEMPLSFFVDPEILDDAEHADVRTISLSYTFFRKEGEDVAAAQ